LKCRAGSPLTRRRPKNNKTAVALDVRGGNTRNLPPGAARGSDNSSYGRFSYDKYTLCRPCRIRRRAWAHIIIDSSTVRYQSSRAVTRLPWKMMIIPARRFVSFVISIAATAFEEHYTRTIIRAGLENVLFCDIINSRRIAFQKRNPENVSAVEFFCFNR